MRAAILTRDGFVIRDQRLPSCGPDQILVKTMACGICEGEVFYYRNRATLLQDEVVNPTFRRKGIALKMIESALKTAKERKIETVKIGVEAKNIPAVKLYTKAGFKEYGRLERGMIRKGEYDDLILLKKDL